MRGRHRRGDGPFRRHGMRRTGPRQAILSALHDADGLVSAEELFVTVHAQHPGIGIATVYRTLQLLTEMGIAVRVDTGDGKARFELTEPDTPLRHVVVNCRRCGRRLTLPRIDGRIAGALAELEESVGETLEFAVEQSTVQLLGLCAECGRAGGEWTERE